MRNCFEFLQKVFSRLDVFVFVCADLVALLVYATFNSFKDEFEM